MTISSWKPVPGAWGVGKIHLKFTPVKKKSVPIGFVLFILLGLVNFSFLLWPNNFLRSYILAPSLRKITYGVEFSRLWMHKFYLIYSKKFDSSHKLMDSTEIYRYSDTGVPIVFASNVNDALYTQGYLHAKDRLFQMEVSRRIASGTLAELLGHNFLLDDRIVRINKIYRDALNDLKYQTEEELNLLRAYTDGVNSYIDRLNIGSELLSLPAEFVMLQVKNIEPWRIEDTLAILRFSTWRANSNWEDELFLEYLNSKLLYKIHRSSKAFAMVYEKVKNTFVVIYGNSSLTHSPLLFNNIQNHMGSVETCYHMSIVTKNSLQDDSTTSGCSWPGVPFILYGHNNHLSWIMNPVPNYKSNEESSPQGESSIIVDYISKYKNIIKDQENINIRNEKDPFVQNILEVADIDSFDITSLVDENILMSLTRSGQGQGQLGLGLGDRVFVKKQRNMGRVSILPLYSMNYAKNKEDFYKAASILKYPGYKVIVADKHDVLVVNNDVYQKDQSSSEVDKIVIDHDPIGISNFKKELQESVLPLYLKRSGNTNSNLHEFSQDSFSPSSLVLRDFILSIPVTFNQKKNSDFNEINSILKKFSGFYKPKEKAPVFLEIFRITFVHRLFHPILKSHFFSDRDHHPARRLPWILDDKSELIISLIKSLIPSSSSSSSSDSDSLSDAELKKFAIGLFVISNHYNHSSADVNHAKIAGVDPEESMEVIFDMTRAVVMESLRIGRELFGPISSWKWANTVSNQVRSILGEKYTAFDEIFLLGKNSYDNFGGFDSVHKASSNLKLHTEDGHVKLIGTNFNYYKTFIDMEKDVFDRGNFVSSIGVSHQMGSKYYNRVSYHLVDMIVRNSSESFHLEDKLIAEKTVFDLKSSSSENTFNPSASVDL